MRRLDPAGGRTDQVSHTTRSSHDHVRPAPRRLRVLPRLRAGRRRQRCHRRLLAENVVLIGPLSDEPLTGREAVAEAIQTVHTLAADLTYEEVPSGETHHAAFFRLQIEDTVVNGMDYALLDADGKIAEVTIWWRPLPSAVEMQGHLAHVLGMQPWELRTNGA